MSVYCGDGEPVAYYRETRRTARKQHDCCACEIPILPGHTYWVIATCYDGSVRGWKRCARCQLIHVELRPLCSENDEWPDEKLNCGHTFEENYGRPPPAWMAALAFWQPGDPLPQVNGCRGWTPICRDSWRANHRCQSGTLPWRCWPSRMSEPCTDSDRDESGHGAQGDPAPGCFGLCHLMKHPLSSPVDSSSAE